MRESISVKFDVWRKFYAPFKCSCCGKEISKQQFRFSCLCGYCDLGKCQHQEGTIITRQGYEKGHNLKLWKEAEINTKLQILENLKDGNSKKQKKV